MQTLAKPAAAALICQEPDNPLHVEFPKLAPDSRRLGWVVICSTLINMGSSRGCQAGVTSPVTCGEGAAADALISPGAFFTALAPAAGMGALT